MKIVKQFFPSGLIRGSYVYNDAGKLVAGRVWDNEGQELAGLLLYEIENIKEQDERGDTKASIPTQAPIVNPIIPEPSGTFVPFAGDTRRTYWLVEQLDGRGYNNGTYLKMPRLGERECWTRDVNEAYRMADFDSTVRLATLVNHLRERPDPFCVAAEHMDVGGING